MLLPDGNGLVQSWLSVTDKAARSARGQVAKIGSKLGGRDASKFR